MVAAADSLAAFGPDDRDRISRQRGVDLEARYPDERRALYQDVLEARLADGDLDANDRSVLAHVADTLALTPADLRPVHERAFGIAVADALEDGRLAVEERLLLYKLQHALDLDPRLASGAYAVLARERLVELVAKALGDGLLSPDEEAHILEAAAALDVEVPADLEALLDGARSGWEARSGAGRPPAPVALAKRERARYQTGAWWRLARPSKLTAWAGYAAVQAGQTQGLVVPPSVLKGESWSGSATVTDRRLVLAAERADPADLPLDRVEQTLRFRNGAVVRVTSGRRYFVDAGPDRDEFYRHLYHAVEDARVGLEAAPDPPPRPRRRPTGPGRERVLFEFADVRWRKVLTDEVAGASYSWIGAASPSTVAKRLGQDSDALWQRADVGTVEIDADHLTLRRRVGTFDRRSALRTVEVVHRRGALLWVRRVRAHDWLLRCPSGRDAERMVHAFRSVLARS